MFPDSNSKLNLNSEIIQYDETNQHIIVKHKNSELILKLNEEFESSNNLIKLIFRGMKNLTSSNTIPINLINVQINENKITFTKEMESYLIVEPNILINVTDLTKFDFYERSIFNRKFSNFKPNKHTLIGNIVHEVFEEIIMHITMDKKKYFEKLRKKLKESIKKNIIYFVMLGLNIKKIEHEIKEHLNALYLYIKTNRNFHFNKEILSEHYIIDSDLGMKGKIDSVVMSNEKIIAVELKTGKTWKKHAKTGHSYQAQAYSLLLEKKHKDKKVVPPLIIYSGDHKKYDFRKPNKIKLGLKVDLDYKSKCNVLNLRNRLASDEFFFNNDYENQVFQICDKCFHNEKCNCINNGKIKTRFELDALLIEAYNKFDTEQKLYFNEYNKFLNLESLSIKRNFSNYFRISSEEKINSGKRIKITEIIEKKSNLVKINCINNSEIRENDMCLVSDKYGPVDGNVAQAFVRKITSKSLELNFMKPINFDPKWIDSLRSDSIFEVNYSSLFNFFQNTNLNYLQNAILKNVNIQRNKELKIDIKASNFDLNENQKKAVMLSMGISNLLLIQGPPGTGKTSTIAMIVRELNKLGKKIILASFTHRALEEMVKKINELDSDINVFRLDNLRFSDEDVFDQSDISKTNQFIFDDMKKITDNFPIYASTSYSWASGKYDSLIGKEGYDVAIIDEASQMIMPNSIGVLRLAKSHILVGDHHQQPPILTNNEQTKLNKTLFQELFDNAIIPESSKVMLNTQHRMNPVLGSFISHEFYNGKLLNNSKIQFKKIFEDTEAPTTIGKICNPDDIITIVDTKNISYDINLKSFEEDGEIILDIFKYMVDKNVNPLNIGIIAPYRAQVALIRRKINSLFNYESPKLISNDIVDTVDRFQGDERDIIIFSACVSDKNISKFLGDKRKINVALSRAKKKLVIVGNWNAAKKYDVFKSLDNYVKDNKQSKLIRI